MESILLRKLTPASTDSEFEGPGSLGGQVGSGSSAGAGAGAGAGVGDGDQGSSGAGISGGLGGSSSEYTRDVVFLKVTITLCIIHN